MHVFFLKNYSPIDGYEAEENAKLTSHRSVVISTQCVNGLCTIKFLFGFSIKNNGTCTDQVDIFLSSVAEC